MFQISDEQVFQYWNWTNQQFISPNKNSVIFQMKLHHINRIEIPIIDFDFARNQLNSITNWTYYLYKKRLKVTYHVKYFIYSKSPLIYFRIYQNGRISGWMRQYKMVDLYQWCEFDEPFESINNWRLKWFRYSPIICGGVIRVRVGFIFCVQFARTAMSSH